MVSLRRRLRRRGSGVLLAGAVVLLGGCTGGDGGTSSASASGAGSGSPGADGSAVGLEQTYTEVVKRVLPSVVQIETSSGLGSGVIYDGKGDIVTNAHVVGDARRFVVRTASSGTVLSATLVAAYQPDDVAVIRLVNPPTLPPAQFGDSQALRVGDIVLAMGSPLGLSGSVTDGIVSATGRTVAEPAEGGSAGATLPGVIQTSAAINPGNSGGALVDLDGKVIGIPTLAAVDQQIGGSAPGIGFAIPSDIVTDIADQIIASGRVVNSHRAALDVSVVTVVGADGTPEGVGIARVTPNGPADKAGLRPGDVIVAVNGTPTLAASDLTAVLADLDPGSTVTVTYQRGGSEHTTKVTLGQLAGS